MATLPPRSSSSPEWLSLPADLINDSFADDLIRQFDKKRSCLHRDLEQTQHQQSRKSTSASSDHPITTAPAQPSSSPSTGSSKKPRRSSAGELLRRSSAFFKTTLDSTWKNISRSHENLCSNDQPEIPGLPETIAIHTTITFPPNAKKSPSSSPFPPLFLSPPVISQYPPKPLQYSPITVPAESHKTLMHRLSMPALRHNTSNQQQSSSNSINVPFFIKRKKSNQL